VRNRGGITQEDKNLQYLRNGYYYGLIGSHIRAFDWYQNQRPGMTLNGVAVSSAPSFYIHVPAIISGTGEATDFKFGWYILRVYAHETFW